MSNDEIEAVARIIRYFRHPGRSNVAGAEAAIAALTALGWQKVPEGSVVVPMKPTKKMQDKLFAMWESARTFDEMYRAMLAARPDAGKGE